MIFFSKVLHLLTYLDFYSRKTFHANVKTENPIFVFSVHYLCTSKVNLFFEYVEFSCHFSSLLSTCSYMEHAAIALYFRNFCTRSWCWCAISVSKIWEGKKCTCTFIQTDLNLILQFIDYMHTSYFLFFIFYFFKSMVKFQAYPDYFFFELILIYCKYSYYIPIPKINRLYLEFKALTHSSNCK